MIVFDLQCGGGGHRFEGWFSSSDDYERQRATGLLQCPVCGDGTVRKAVMAPAVGAKSNQIAPARPNSPPPQPQSEGGTVPVSAGNDNPKLQELMKAMAHAQAEMLQKSEWVGRGFADKARAMHYGEEDARPIHGEVAAQEARSLIEEGVEVAPLLFPVVPPAARN
ncbi:MAG: DUF1178 family protein [Sphingobium sp.]|nr:DUF1178 family protein [Sphingobium sp.]MBP6110847.1 DUF1178 family protein [Sphingobium sp.]MBP8670009.1 DUF1178 family protein [Sphingobium sp.]MBP9157126.1 DUF1178 family protein [Sphingobium sp.]MCC6481075.1 DUF1178 family protein [Sphingomonadaceae bacterium]